MEKVIIPVLIVLVIVSYYYGVYVGGRQPDDIKHENKFRLTHLMTDDLINDAMVGLSAEDKIKALKKIFGRDWREHLQ